MSWSQDSDHFTDKAQCNIHIHNAGRRETQGNSLVIWKGALHGPSHKT